MSHWLGLTFWLCIALRSALNRCIFNLRVLLSRTFYWLSCVQCSCYAQRIIYVERPSRHFTGYFAFNVRAGHSNSTILQAARYFDKVLFFEDFNEKLLPWCAVCQKQNSSVFPPLLIPLTVEITQGEKKGVIFRSLFFEHEGKCEGWILFCFWLSSHIWRDKTSLLEFWPETNGKTEMCGVSYFLPPCRLATKTEG